MGEKRRVQMGRIGASTYHRVLECEGSVTPAIGSQPQSWATGGVRRYSSVVEGEWPLPGCQRV